jgi:DNA-binding XRE family transcriptional regulator
MFHVGDVIRKLREQKGRNFTQTSLGQLAGLNKDTIRRIEQGEQMRQDTLAKIASVFDLTLADLYRFVPLPPDDVTTLRTNTYNERLWRAWERLDSPEYDDVRVAIVELVERVVERRHEPRPRRRQPK